MQLTTWALCCCCSPVGALRNTGCANKRCNISSCGASCPRPLHGPLRCRCTSLLRIFALSLRRRYLLARSRGHQSACDSTRGQGAERRSLESWYGLRTSAVLDGITPLFGLIRQLSPLAAHLWSSQDLDAYAHGACAYVEQYISALVRNHWQKDCCAGKSKTPSPQAGIVQNRGPGASPEQKKTP